MDLTDLQSVIDSLNFTEIIKREAYQYFIEIKKDQETFGRDYRKLFIVGLKKFHRQEDKIIYLVEALNHYHSQIAYFTDLIVNFKFDDPDDEGDFWGETNDQHKYNRLEGKRRFYETQVFFVVRDLEKLGIKNLEANAFDNTEVSDLDRKINAILIKLDELSVGQEVVFNSIEELKSDLKELKSEFPLGKKRWYQRATGMIVNFAGEKGADEIYEALKPLLKDFFSTHARYLLDKL